jgi:hypothetical protein
MLSSLMLLPLLFFQAILPQYCRWHMLSNMLNRSEIRCCREILRCKSVYFFSLVVQMYFYFKCHVYYMLLHSHHLISTLVPSSSSSFVGFFFGSSICSTPLLILALTLEDTISSGIGILR